MTQTELRDRAKLFALQIIHLVDAIPATRSGNVIANQLVRSGTSVGANYRSACKAKSDRDFLDKMAIIEEEADKTIYWLELLRESGLTPLAAIEPIWKEFNELTAIFTASGRAVRGRLDRSTGNNVRSHSDGPELGYNSESEIRDSESGDPE